MKILSYGETHRGRVRAHNEDAVLVRGDLGLFAVADGVGGLPDGDYASERALELLAAKVGEAADGAVDLEAVLAGINRSILLEGHRRHPRVGIATTLTCLLVRNERVWIGHLGDSMAWRLRDNHLRTLTTEHTVAAEIQGRRESVPSETMPGHYYHTLTRCIGESEPTAPEIIAMETASRDRFLLASDGLTKVIRRQEIHALFHAASSPEDATRALMKKALAMGAPDNVSVVSLFVA
ncbi:MAG: serine/threonine-protein phosphatase [Opitutales bacterium]|nr:serine/threonine-protein phosphatase [Opitutales bacterium]